MSKVTLAAAARADLKEIWFRIAKEFENPSAAKKYLQEVERKLQLLAQNPYIGVARPEIDERELRSTPCRDYVIFYRPIENGIYVFRVLHHARDRQGAF